MIDAIRRVAQRGTAPTVQEAEAIVSFVALQRVRGPAVLDELNRFTVEARRLQLEMIARNPRAYESTKKRLLAKHPDLKPEDLPSADEILKWLDDDTFVVRMNNTFLVINALEAQKAVFEALANMELRFYRAPPGTEFVTGDRPIVLVPHEDVSMTPTGIVTAKAVLMPLTPNLLFMARPERPYRLVEGIASVELVQGSNSVVSEQSRWTFSASPFKRE